MAKGRSIRVYINAHMEKRLAKWRKYHPGLDGIADSAIFHHCLIEVTDKLPDSEPLASPPNIIDSTQPAPVV